MNKCQINKPFPLGIGQRSVGMGVERGVAGSTAHPALSGERDVTSSLNAVVWLTIDEQEAKPLF